MKKLCFLSVLLIVISCQKDKNYDQIQMADWLIGDWEYRSSDGHFTERWKVLNDSSFVGNSYFVIDKDTVFAEKAVLVQKQDALYYVVEILTEQNDRATEFKMTSSTDKTLIFENPQNDFPQKITYNFVNKDSIYAEISGGGNPQGFPMSREK